MSKKIFRAMLLPLVLGLTISLLLVATASAAVWTDQEDYQPGSVVTIHGDNSDSAGFLPGETIVVYVQGPNGYASTCTAIANEQSDWSCQVTLWDDELAIGEYSYMASGQSSGVTQNGAFTDSAGWYYTCYLKPDGSVDCWGNNSYGQANNQPGPFTRVSAGGIHTCGLKPDGSVDCWGNNWYGQASDHPGPFTQIDTGWYHTCGLKPDGSVDCWANNWYGQSHDQPGPFTQITTGSYHTCGLKPDGSVDCWGHNYFGQSNYQSGPFTQISAGAYHTCGLKPDGSIDCWGTNWYGQATDQPGPFTQVIGGGYHTCGLKPDGSVDCWGQNYLGQANDQSGPFLQVIAGGYHNCGLNPDGSVDCWGYNNYGQATDQTGPYVAYIDNPRVTNILANPNPASVNTDIDMSAVVSDTFGSTNIKSAEYSLDDGVWNLMSASDGAFDSPSEEVEAAIVGGFGQAGIHKVCVRGTTEVGSTNLDEYCYVLVVYDPSGGFVTGGGWIWSYPGTYINEPDVTGWANFGFVAKYHKGADVPDGQAELVYHTAGMNFHSSEYDWLVVTGGDSAKFKGSGTINGEGDYKFMIWAADGEPDTFRIKIWEETEGEEAVIYDNSLGHPEFENGQPIGKGSIVVRDDKETIISAQCLLDTSYHHFDTQVTYHLEFDLDTLGADRLRVYSWDRYDDSIKVEVKSLSTGSHWSFTEPSCGTICGYHIYFYNPNSIGEGPGIYEITITQDKKGDVMLYCAD